MIKHLLFAKHCIEELPVFSHFNLMAGQFSIVSDGHKRGG